MTIKHVSEFFGLDWDVVKNADKEALERRLTGFDPRQARTLAMDEFAIQRGHRYASVVINVEKGNVLLVS
jgi:transposase